jgi:hypothetical protein
MLNRPTVRVRYRFSVEPEACALIPAEASFNESTKLFSADCRKPIEAFIMKICTYKQFGDLMFQAGMFRDFLHFWKRVLRWGASQKCSAVVSGDGLAGVA